MSVNPPHPNKHYGKKPSALFLMGPVPLSWCKAAIEAGGSALAVGVCLWHLKGMKKSPEDLIITRKRAKETLGIGEDSLSRGLDRLETAGLITTTRGRGKAIRVTIISPVLALRFQPALQPGEVHA